MTDTVTLPMMIRFSVISSSSVDSLSGLNVYGSSSVNAHLIINSAKDKFSGILLDKFLIATIYTQ